MGKLLCNVVPHDIHNKVDISSTVAFECYVQSSLVSDEAQNIDVGNDIMYQGSTEPVTVKCIAALKFVVFPKNLIRIETETSSVGIHQQVPADGYCSLHAIAATRETTARNLCNEMLQLDFFQRLSANNDNGAYTNAGS